MSGGMRDTMQYISWTRPVPAASGILLKEGRYCQSPLVGTVIQYHELGDCLIWEGKVFRYAHAGTNKCYMGRMMQSENVVDFHTNQTIARTYAAGASTVIMDIGAAAAAANLYKNGRFWVNGHLLGYGQERTIKSNLVAAGSDELTLTLYNALNIGLTINVSEVSVAKNVYKDILEVPATGLTALPVGVPLAHILANYYGWIVTDGPAAVLCDDTDVLIPGEPVRCNDDGGALNDAGAVGLVTAVTDPIVGKVIQVLAPADYALIDLALGRPLFQA